MTIRWMMAFWDYPPETFETGTTFWLKATDGNLSEPIGPHNEFAALRPREGDPSLWVQRMFSGEARNHLDFEVDELPAEAARAEELGARVVHREEGLVVLHSPGGFPFCLVEHEYKSRVPTPAEWPGGHRSIADQICLDIPPAHYQSEREFWEAFTGRVGVRGTRSEFTRLARPEDMPLEILLQRLADAGAHEPVRAHMDLACSDVDAETARHTELGAVPLERFDHWQVMRDPAGLEYCITTRVPGQAG
jgi:hypothetical protein